MVAIADRFRNTLFPIALPSVTGLQVINIYDCPGALIVHKLACIALYVMHSGQSVIVRIYPLKLNLHDLVIQLFTLFMILCSDIS